MPNRLNTNSEAISILQSSYEKKKLHIQEEKLKNMKWGMGLEHETQYYYLQKPNSVLPSNEKSNKIKITRKIYDLSEIVLCLTKEFLEDIINGGRIEREYLTNNDVQLLQNIYSNITESEKEYLSSIDYEETGRKCDGKIVLDKILYKNDPIRMPEFITNNPFSKLINQKTIHNYVFQLRQREELFEKIIIQHPIIKKFINSHNIKIIQYPFGMTSNIKVRNDYYSTSEKLDKKTYRDYCGSYHFTITLPFEDKEKYTKEDEEKFVSTHYNFGAMFQWIEPLLLASYFSCDQDAVGTSEKKIRGSFRVARVGWGNFAGSNMRKKNKGVGRYADVEQKWRKSFDFYESNITKYCNAPFKSKKESAISSFSSNIRTFAPSITSNPKNRISGAPMKIPNGMEIRIFDHFPVLYLESLLQIIVLISANSKRKNIEVFVYDDKDWIDTIRKIMLEGWRADISPLYVKKLEEMLDLQIELKSYMAFDVLVAVVSSLYEKNKNSDFVYLMYGNNVHPQIPMINKYSWDFAFMLKLVKDEDSYKKYIIFLQKLTTISKINEIEDVVIDCMGKSWKDNWKDIMYFLSEKNLIQINDEKFEINTKLMKNFIGKKMIEDEILLQYSIKNVDYKMFNSKKDSFFSRNEIKKRYRKLIPKVIKVM